MSVRIKTDGDTLTVNQSAIATYLRCPEAFRLGAGVEVGGEILGSDARLEADASTCGTVFHSFVEQELNEGQFKTLGKAQAWAKTEMTRVLKSYADEGVTYVQSSFGKNPDAIYSKLDKLVSIWFHSQERRVWLELKQHHPEQLLTEYQFDIPFFTRTGGRYKEIRLAGTVDIVDRYNHQLIDWKTSSRYKQPWEEQRWSVQASTYTFAAATNKLIDSHDDGMYHFGLRVFNHKSNDTEPQGIVIKRNQDHWGWLIEVVNQMVGQIESDLTAWTMNDTHALCSPKWCPHWDDCKGRYIGEDW